MKSLLQALRMPAVQFSPIMGLLVGGIIIGLDLKFKPDPQDILVEAHGLVFDIILFGIILTIYDTILRNREEARREADEIQDTIQRYTEEIDDFRGWKGEEVRFRILGNVRRLNKLGVTNIDLNRCSLDEAELIELNLNGSSLLETGLRNAKIYRTSLQNTQIRGAVLSDADLFLVNASGAKLQCLLRRTEFTGIDFSDADLEECDLESCRFLPFEERKQSGPSSADLSTTRCNFKGANLRQWNAVEVTFQMADLQETQWTHAVLEQVSFTNCDLSGADFSYAELSQVVFHGCCLDNIRWQGARFRNVKMDSNQKETLQQSGYTNLSGIIFE